MNKATSHSWRSVRELVYAKILDSTYARGDKLPKDADIAAELGCARTTVQRAMRDLANSGIVIRRRKGGTHVHTNPVTRATLDIPITRNEVEQKGSIYGYLLLKQSTLKTPLSIAANFGLIAPVKMLKIEALHMADKRPYIYEDRWISTTTVPEIKQVNLEQESANEWLVRNRPYSRCDIRVYASRAGEYYAKLFETDQNSALFIMERTTWIGNEPITSVKAVAGPGYQLLTQAGSATP